MPYYSADEIKVRYIEQMGRPLGEQFNGLWQEVAWLHVKWQQFVELFGTKLSRVDLLNRAAPTFFRVAQDSLWEDILLHICRLTDPSESGARKTNLTIRNLPNLEPALNMNAKVAELAAVAVEKSELCRDWQNRRIAHKDLALALNASAEPLHPASQLHVREALGAIVAVLNEVSRAYGESGTYFDFPRGAGGAVSLLHVMKDGLNSAKSRKERLKCGEWTPDDLSADRDI